MTRFLLWIPGDTGTNNDTYAPDLADSFEQSTTRVALAL